MNHFVLWDSLHKTKYVDKKKVGDFNATSSPKLLGGVRYSSSFNLYHSNAPRACLSCPFSS